MRFLLIPLALAGLWACQSKTKSNETSDAERADTTSMTTTYALPDSSGFTGTLDGKPVRLFVLKNERLQVAITNYGARIVSIIVPDKTGKPTDVIPGPGSLKGFQGAGEAFMGPIVGRVANRIANGRFVLDGKEYKTEINNGKNTLHGGPSGFHSRVWDAKSVDDKTLELRYVAQAGEGGFPGTLSTTVTYSLTDDGIKIDYVATTDAPTPVNLTNHAFFNLNGAGSGTINGHTLRLNADKYSAVDAGLIPVGEPQAVEGTPFDFRKATTIGARVDVAHEQLKFGGGYDHNFVLIKPKSGELTEAADVVGDKSGIRMVVETTEPAIQFYGGNFFKAKDLDKGGQAIDYREAFALEAQHYPDAVNHPTYPNTILRPSETYRQTTIYRFPR